MSDSGRMAEDSFRTDSVRVLGALMRRFGNLDLAEDAFQDACLAAVETWPEQGVPLNPGAWLTTVAGNAALDRIRREAKRLPKEAEAAGLRATGFGAGTGFERYAGVPNEPVSPGPDTEYDLSLLDDGPLTDDQLRLRSSPGLSWLPKRPWRSDSCERNARSFWRGSRSGYRRVTSS
jgi:DNA-directed RNA polymerase specialized sigma24 family protein